jgi:DNA-binding LacI/PurR family transcriptional regulator
MNWHGAIARHEGFEEALAEFGLQAAGSIEGNWTSESGYQAAEALLRQSIFTAIVCANDQMALGAMARLREAGIAIPNDVSIVGFDDIPEAPFFSPALTTIRQDFSDLGRKGLGYLLAIIEDPDEEKRQHVIQPQLVLRDSTQAPS